MLFSALSPGISTALAGIFEGGGSLTRALRTGCCCDCSPAAPAAVPEAKTFAYVLGYWFTPTLVLVWE